MPKMKPDRDDSRGNMAGQGGPQHPPIGRGSDSRQQQDPGEVETSGADGAGTQRHPGGSSRDSK